MFCFVRHKKNGGLPAARNTGVKRAETEYVCFLDCDNLLKRQFVKEMIGTCQKLNTGAVKFLMNNFSQDVWLRVTTLLLLK